MKKIKNSYKKSGVNISLANKLVKHISILSKKGVKKTKNPFEKDVIGGFGSLFDLSKIKIKDPVIVSPATNTPAVSSIVRVVPSPLFTIALAPDVEPVTLSLFMKLPPTEVVRLRVEPVILC